MSGLPLTLNRRAPIRYGLCAVSPDDSPRRVAQVRIAVDAVEAAWTIRSRFSIRPAPQVNVRGKANRACSTSTGLT